MENIEQISPIPRNLGNVSPISQKSPSSENSTVFVPNQVANESGGTKIQNLSLPAIELSKIYPEENNISNVHVRSKTPSCKIKQILPLNTGDLFKTEKMERVVQTNKTTDKFSSAEEKKEEEIKHSEDPENLVIVVGTPLEIENINRANENHENEAYPQFNNIDLEVSRIIQAPPEVVAAAPNNISLNDIEQNQDLAVENMNNLQASINQIELNLLLVQEPEANIYLGKVVGFFLAALIGALEIIAVFYFDFSGRGLFAVWIGYLTYLGFVDLFWTLRIVGDAWRESQDIYKLYDVFIMGLSTSFIYLRVTNVIETSKFICCSFFILGFASLVSRKIPTRDRTVRVTLRFYFFLQAMFICLKIDGNVAWAWELILAPSWVVMLAILYLSVGFLIRLFKKLSRASTSQARNLPTKAKIIGLTWYMIYCGYSIIGLATLDGLSNALNEVDGYKTLCGIAVVTIIKSITALCLTFHARKNQLIKFIIVFDLIESHLKRIEAPNETRVRVFQVEKKEVYFFMVSPTYYLPLEGDLFLKDKEYLKQMEEKIKLRKSHSKNLDQVSSIKIVKIDRGEDVERLKEFHKKLSLKFLDDKGVKEMTSSNQHGLNKSTIVAPEDIQQQQHDKSILSMNDLEEAKRLSKNEEIEKVNGEDNLCYICCKNNSNVIFADCGHGGLCYSCAATSVLKKNKCTECRARIEGIYKIKPLQKFPKIVKTVELSKLIVKTI